MELTLCSHSSLDNDLITATQSRTIAIFHQTNLETRLKMQVKLQGGQLSLCKSLVSRVSLNWIM